MKQILITLLTFFTLANIANASYRLQIVPTDSKYASMQLSGDTQEEVNKKLIKWIDKQRFFKGFYNNDPIGSIVSKTVTNELDEEKTLYFHPSNFSVNLVDDTQELADKEAKKLAKQTLKDKLNSGKKDLTLKEINELLRD